MLFFIPSNKKSLTTYNAIKKTIENIFFHQIFFLGKFHWQEIHQESQRKEISIWKEFINWLAPTLLIGLTLKSAAIRTTCKKFETSLTNLNRRPVKDLCRFIQQAKSVVKVTSFRFLTKGSTGKTVHLKRRSWGSNLTHTYDKFRKKTYLFRH